MVLKIKISVWDDVECEDMAEHNDLGKWGEDYAVEYLRHEGYIILERDWRNGRSKRDIDIICKTADRTTVVFVEVKTRSREDVARPEDAVNIRKIRNIGQAADQYVKNNNVVEELRFDIIAIVGRMGDCNVKLEHIVDAFNPLLI